MPTYITTAGQVENTYKVTVAFTDDAGNAVTPNDGCTWSLQSSGGDVINSRTAVAITEATSVTIVLSGDDLAAQSVNDDGRRVLIIDGDYDSDAGNGLSLYREFEFVIPCQLPVSLDEQKQYANISHTNQDIVLTGLIQAAREWIELYLGRKLMAQTVTEYFSRFPGSAGNASIYPLTNREKYLICDDASYFKLPYGSLNSVTSITYKKSDATTSTVSSDNYTLVTDTQLGRIVLNNSESWPSDSLFDANPITIIYNCGYGSNYGDVPGAIRTAIMLMVNDLFTVRQTQFVGTPAGGYSYMETPTIKRLLSPYKLEWF